MSASWPDRRTSRRSRRVSLNSKVLQPSLPWVAQLARSSVRRRLLVMLSRDEIAGISAEMQGEHAVRARLLCTAPA